MRRDPEDWFARSSRRVARLCFVLLLFGAAPTTALPPPTELDVPVDGGRPRVQGERPPPPGTTLVPKKPSPPIRPRLKGDEATGKSLAGAQAAPKGKRPSAAESRLAQSSKAVPAVAAAEAEKKAAQTSQQRRHVVRPVPAQRDPVQSPPTANASLGAEGASTVRSRRSRRSTGARTIVVLADVGELLVPRALVSLAAGYDNVAELRANGVDLTLMRPATDRHHYGVRLGLVQPTTPGSNWYNNSGDKIPVFHDVRMTLVNVAFEYAYRRLVLGPVGLQLRVGLGANIVMGGIERAEVLPTCEAPIERCPHWREVGRYSSTLPSPVWPALRATAGVFVQLGEHLGLQVDAGLRDAMYMGAGLAFRK